MTAQWYMPLDPDCPDNPINGFWEDPMSQACQCGNEIVAHLEQKHRMKCKRCQEYGVANVEVGP